MITLIVAGVTAFYMSRLFFMTFHGKARWSHDEGSTYVQRHPHESPKLMTIPMILLSLGSVFLGGLLSINNSFVTFLEPVTGHAEHHDPVIPIPVIMASTLILVAAGVFLAWRQYGAAPVPTVAPKGSLLTQAARADLYQDATNEALFMRPGQYATRSLVFADKKAVDGSFMGVATLVASLGIGVKKLHNGFVRSYAAMMLGGLVLLLIIILAIWN
jgi:NADH-quinone oxidoreductase subunit L